MVKEVKEEEEDDDVEVIDQEDLIAQVQNVPFRTYFIFLVNHNKILLKVA